jgi:regulator of CtrA degradation
VETVNGLAAYWSDGRGIVNGQTAPTAFFSRTYDEAIALLEGARDYIARHEPVDRQRLAAPEQLRLCCETLRMTARLTQIMAWLLAQRAVHAGEISAADVVRQHEALSDVEICMAHKETDLAGLPIAMANLAERSQRLYVRVARLDDMVRRQHSEPLAETS